MTALLLEHPVVLAFCWLVIEGTLVAVWSSRRTRATRRAVLIGLAALPVLEAVSLLVVTQPERVTSICRDMAAAVERDDMEALARHLDAEFSAVDLDRDAFLDAVSRTLAQFEVKEPYLHQFEVLVSPRDAAVAEFNSSCYVVGTGIRRQRLLSRWRVMFRRRGDTWRMITVEALPLPLSPIRNLRDVLR
jgi:hypothetical protein